MAEENAEIELNAEGEQEPVQMEEQQDSTGVDPVPESNGDDAPAQETDMAADADAVTGGGDVQADASGAAGDGDDDESRKLFVGGLSWNTTEAQLKEYFSRFGEVKNCTLKEEGGRSRGFGFVTFFTAEGCDKVLSHTEKHELDHRTIDPKKAQPREAKKDVKPAKNKIFVGGLDTDLKKEEVEEHFSQYGEIELLELPGESSGARKAFAFITFKTEEGAENACKEPKKKLGKRECEVKLATQNPRQPFGGRGGARGGRGAGWGYQQGGYGGYGGYSGYGGYGGYGAYPGYDQYGGWGQAGYGGGYGGYGGGYDYWGAGGYDQQQSTYGKAPRGGRGGYHHPYQR